MSENGLKNEFALHLAEFLRYQREKCGNFVIQKFDIEGNSISIEGLQEVQKELHKNQLAQQERDKPKQQQEILRMRIQA